MLAEVPWEIWTANSLLNVAKMRQWGYDWEFFFLSSMVSDAGVFLHGVQSFPSVKWMSSYWQKSSVSPSPQNAYPILLKNMKGDYLMDNRQQL